MLYIYLYYMTGLATTKRIHSIDILRGLVMVIMALDHTRDFFHNQAISADPLDPATTNAVHFFTRWITHYCAPLFVFFSGISAYLASQNKDSTTAASFLMQRGLLLVLLEITVVTFGLTFNPLFSFIILQVIWAIGWSMFLLGVLIKTARKSIFFIGVAILLIQNLLPYFNLPQEGPWKILLQVLINSRGAVVPLSPTHFVAVFYTILPWTAVMFIGYSIGNWFQSTVPDAVRKQRLRITGVVLCLLFILLRFWNQFGDLQPWQSFDHVSQNLFSFLNTTKYPPSLQFFCMTIGPGLLLLSFMSDSPSKAGRWLMLYGRVPLFYYVLHFYLIHLLTVFAFFLSGYTTAQIADPQSPFLFRPVNFGYSLPVVYLIWLAVVCSLYWPCRWFYQYKLRRKNSWLRFV